MIWFVLLVLWPLAELFVIVKISEAIGFLWVLLLLILSWPVGTRIIRLEGRAALRRLRDALAAGRAPTNEVLDGALVLFGGLLLLVPRRLAARHHHSAWLNRAVSFITWGARGGRGGRPPGYDADSTAVDLDDPQLEA
jgi:hypothetical protein